MNKDMYLLRDAITNTVRFGLFDQITSLKQAEKVKTKWINQMTAIGVKDVDLIIEKVDQNA